MTTTNLDQILSTSDIESVSDYLGGHFFDAATMRFFNSKITPYIRTTGDLSGYFITSEKHDTDPRHWRVRSYRVERYVRDGAEGRVCDRMVIDTLDPMYTNVKAARAAMHAL